jgi:hypothetical protein
VKDLKDLRQLEAQDIRRREREARREQRLLERADRQDRRREAWPRWMAWWEQLAKELKIAATVIGSSIVIGSAAVKYGRIVGHAARRAWAFYADRGPDVPTPIVHPGERLAPDRVSKPGGP